jgi:2-methylcitrate dehydratase
VNTAVCAGKLLGLDRLRLEHAIELAWMLAPVELDGVFRSAWWRSVGQGNILICHAGMNAALLAAHGVAGPLGLVEAEGIYDCEGLPDLNRPEPFHYIRREMHLKPWIGSRGTHGAIQLAREIVHAETLRPEDIEEIVVRCRALYLRPPFDCARPSTWQDAAYSVQWTMAMAILGYHPGPEWLQEGRLRDAVALRLASTIRLVEDPVATEIWESGRRFAPDLSNTISITARGQVYTRGLRAAEFLGSPQAPMSDEEVADKFLRLSIPVIGTERAAKVLRWVNNLDEQADIGTLMPLLVPV